MRDVDGSYPEEVRDAQPQGDHLLELPRRTHAGRAGGTTGDPDRKGSPVKEDILPHGTLYKGWQAHYELVVKYEEHPDPDTWFVTAAVGVETRGFRYLGNEDWERVDKAQRLYSAIFHRLWHTAFKGM